MRETKQPQLSLHQLNEVYNKLTKVFLRGMIF
jgi:hypothetical protein